MTTIYSLFSLYPYLVPVCMVVFVVVSSRTAMLRPPRHPFCYRSLFDRSAANLFRHLSLWSNALEKSQDGNILPVKCGGFAIPKRRPGPPLMEVSSSSWGTPIAGWFISWKIPSRNGWWLGGTLFQDTSIWILHRVGLNTVEPSLSNSRASSQLVNKHTKAHPTNHGLTWTATSNWTRRQVPDSWPASSRRLSAEGDDPVTHTVGAPCYQADDHVMG